MVIHLFGQFLPGKPDEWRRQYHHFDEVPDSFIDRLQYFKQCINELDALRLDEPVAMPYFIGCVLAGGNWANYEKILKEATTKIIFYKL
jgi:hypothetical protein